MTLRTVRECRDCPFLDFVDGVAHKWYCKHDDRSGDGRVGPGGISVPKWCPLADGATLVQLSKRSEPTR